MTSISAAWDFPRPDGYWIAIRYQDNLGFCLLGSGHELPPVLPQSDPSEQDSVILVFLQASPTCCVLINVIPNSISGVQRARTLVRSQQAMEIVENPTVTCTISDIDLILPHYIHQAISNSGLDGPMSRYSSQNAETVPSKFGKIRSFLRRKTKDDALPPPLPPKDKNVNSLTLPTTRYPLSQGRSNRPRSSSLSDFAVISHDLLLQPTRSLSPTPTQLISPIDISTPQTRPFDPPQTRPFDPPHAHSTIHNGKWSHETPSRLDPLERTRRRMEAERRREVEEQEALQEEAERQSLMKLQKAKAEKQEREAEARRKALLEAQVRIATAERRRKDAEAAEEEKRRLAELENQKRLDKERRLEEGRKMNEQRAKIAEQLAAEQRNAAEIIKQEEEERKSRIKLVGQKVKSVDLASGWVTMQTDSLIWRRRFFRFVGTTIFLYRSPQDMSQALDTAELRNRVAGVREWNHGFDELKAIPHSFAIEFKDTTPWSLYCDSEDEKDKLLVLLLNAAGLKV